MLHPSSVQPLSDHPLAAPLVLVALLELAELPQRGVLHLAGPSSAAIAYK